MAYATADDLKKPGWGLPARALSGIPDDEITQALDSSSAEVDTYLRSQYSLPVSDELALQVLGQKTCHIAAWYLLSGKGFDPTKGSDEAVRLRYSDALKWLRLVADGQVSLITSPAGDSASDDDYGVVVESNSPRGW